LSDVFVAYIHYLSFMCLFAALLVEHLIFKSEADNALAKRLGVIDAIYGVSALLVLTTGLLKVFAVGKPASYFMKNWIFHMKFTTFIIVALISIYPTIKFFKNRKGNADNLVQYPKSLIHVIRLELTLVALMPLMGALMARGHGSF